jgi:hypothetical protein
MKTLKQKNGFIALSSILIISLIVTTIATTLAYLSIGEGQAALAQTKGEEALFLAEGCAEDALIKAWASSSYSGGTVSRPEGSCTIVINKVGSTWTITVTPTATQYQRKIEVIMNEGATVNTVTSWKEV